VSTAELERDSVVELPLRGVGRSTTDAAEPAVPVPDDGAVDRLAGTLGRLALRLPVADASERAWAARAQGSTSRVVSIGRTGDRL
jgi:hypothetical protein